MEAERVFEIFREISAVPRGSYHNTKISRYLMDWAKAHDLQAETDEAENVIIRKPGTRGYENSDTVILQGHMDMVCEKASDVKHDFETEGIELITEGDYIFANGTTLGADDGIAVAMALAVLESKDIEHPPIEAVFTTDEEVGMFGAAALDKSKLQGKRLINIDSEEEGTLLVSCAGGMTAKVEFPLEYESVTGTQVTLTVEGLKGGHSGTEIQKNRTNASDLLARILYELPEKMYRLSSFTGGDKDNVITSRAEAVFVVDDMDTFFETYDIIEENLVTELASKEPDMEISVLYRKAENVSVISRDNQKKILDFLTLSPKGVQVMSGDMEGVVESSLNMGSASISGEKAMFGFSLRSQKKSYRDYLYRKLETLATLCDGKISKEGEYPAWDFREDSRLRDVMKEVYRKQYEKELVVTGIHAGLECGIFYEAMEDIDIVSIGADTFDIHTPKEKLSISSTKRVYQFLLETLKELR